MGPGSTGGALWYAAEWVIRIGALVIVPQRRAPAAATGWLLAMFFLPVPGLLAFLAIGRPAFPAWRHRRFARIRPYLDDVATALAGDTPCGEAESLIRTLGGFPSVGGNAVELIDDYDGMIDRLVADIEAATHSVEILVYIFADDATGRRVIDALARARARGVAARVMLDPVGSQTWRRGTERRLTAADVAWREALPFRVWRDRTRRDMRNHRKLFAIDDRIAYAGSQNIVAKDFRPGVVNRELVVRLTGPAVAAVAATVRADWFLETEEAPTPPDISAPTGDAVVQLLPSGADYPLQGFETLLVWLLHRAEQRIVLVSPYFIPGDALIEALRTTAVRGVTVDLVVSAVVDQRLVNLAQCSYYAELMAAGVRIHRYRDYLLHAKNVGIDGRVAIVGSSNADLRSFQLNEEASLVLVDPATVGAVEAVQAGYLAASDLIDPAAWSKRARWRMVAENAARLISPLL